MRNRPLTGFEHWLYLGIIAALRVAQVVLIGLAVLYIVRVL